MTVDYSGGYAACTVNVDGYFPRLTQEAEVLPGMTYTMLVQMRGAAGQALRVGAQTFTATGGTVTATTEAGITGTGDWAWYSHTFTVPAGSTVVSLWPGVTHNSPIGTTVDMRNIMLVLGSDVPAYADGDSPGWMWLGTVKLSESVGYPIDPTLTPVAWYDGRYPWGKDGQPTDGVVISQWTDLSGSNNHLAQSAAASRPVWDAAEGAVMFDGLDDFMDAAAAGLSQPYTVYAVAYTTGQTGGSYQTLTDGTTAHSTVFFRDSASTGNPITANRWEVNADSTLMSTDLRDLTLPVIVSAVFDGSKSSIDMNGASRGNGNAGLSGMTPRIRVGCVNSPGVHPFKGGVKALLFYSGAHSDADRLRVQKRLSRTYGVPLS